MRTIDIIKRKLDRDPSALIPPGALDIARDLRHHLELSREVLAVIEREAQALRATDPGLPKALTTLKQQLLPRLNHSVDRLRQIRVRWQQFDAAERTKHPEVPALLRENQEVIMKAILLDRENEQSMLRLGLVPAGQLPPSQRQRAHTVADLYRRQIPRNI